MGMTGILAMWPAGSFEQTFVPVESSMWNLTLIGPVVSEEKMFEECGRQRTTEAYLSYKLTNEPMSLRLRWANKESLQGHKGHFRVYWLWQLLFSHLIKRACGHKGLALMFCNIF